MRIIHQARGHHVQQPQMMHHYNSGVTQKFFALLTSSSHEKGFTKKKSRVKTDSLHCKWQLANENLNAHLSKNSMGAPITTNKIENLMDAPATKWQIFLVPTRTEQLSIWKGSFRKSYWPCFGLSSIVLFQWNSRLSWYCLDFVIANTIVSLTTCHTVSVYTPPCTTAVYTFLGQYQWISANYIISN